MVYMKEFDARGFVIYSNFGTSGKARDLFGSVDGVSTGNPWASLVFWWGPMERQVRVEGKVERLSREESQIYFDTRARGSRVGAWSSRQSQVLRPVEGDDDDDGRKELGVEFWHGRQSRLHDRFVYERALSDGSEGEERWTLERLSP
jgi:pyridoxamine 5'-phosphate oxidase